MVSLEFFIDIILLLHYGPGVDSVSDINEYQEYFLGGKGGRCVRLTTLPHCVPIVLKSESLILLESSGSLQACREIALLLLVAARSKEWVCGSSLVGTVGSNPTGGMDVCLL